MTEDELEPVWNGRDALTESLERDYAVIGGEGWDLIWTPTSPLTTPWELVIAERGALDPDAFVAPIQTRPDRAAARLRAEAHELRNDIARERFLAPVIATGRGPRRKAPRILHDFIQIAQSGSRR